LVFRDITEQVRMADELLRASKLDSLGILAGGIAHDFNNILTSVIGNLSLAKMYSAAGDKVFPRLEEAEKASVRAKDLTQQLLTFAKGGAPVRQTASIVELIMDSTQFTLRGSNVRCAFFLPEDLWPADVDEGQISQVINNLVINAMQAMPEGGVIQVRAENANLGEDNGLGLPPGRYVRIAVADCGSGIRPEHLAKIFDPFFTTKQTGSGLGLATAYSIIKRHDGLINVESTLGIGTIFRVYLPASNQPVQTPQVVQIGPLAGQGRVLVMDDEPLIRELAVTALETLGYRVHTVPDGAEAVRCFAEAKARGDPFQALVMDLTIPGGMGGKEAVKKILALDPNARAIVSSGYSNDPVMAHFRDHGFRGVVGKPYRIEELAKALSEVIHDGDK
jgi:CheY-like chemotaxis protein